MLTGQWCPEGDQIPRKPPSTSVTCTPSAQLRWNSYWPRPAGSLARNLGWPGSIGSVQQAQVPRGGFVLMIGVTEANASVIVSIPAVTIAAGYPWPG